MSHFVGKNPVYIIAEIGGNHEGDFEYAKKLTRLAAESGADAVKFQIYTGDSLVNAKYDPTRNKHFKNFELSEEKYIELAKLCEDLGITFMASVWDMEAFSWIDPYIPIYKVGSGDLTAYPLLKKMVLTGKPMILSTGLSTFEEVQDAVDFINSVDPKFVEEQKLSILQCTSMYPIPYEDANLNVMCTYMEEFDLPIGYSDHTVGMEAIETAIVMGAEIIEVHFTDCREGKVFRDHKVSATCSEIQELIKKIDRINTLKGSYEKKPTPSEINAKHVDSFRRGVFVTRDIKQGETLTESDLITLRPNIGTGAENFYKLIGTKVSENLDKLSKIK
ncbi:MAG: N-acetylneuraminate synthase family protein [Candidatus Cloacimonetes bacterium]|nr:N-acetylneuraminate synthase family protein [Candidatus Cloacimonadota bacterium]